MRWVGSDAASRRGRQWAIVAIACLAWIGCEATPGLDGGPIDELEACADGGPRPGPTPRLIRLTHHQYDNVVHDLLGYQGDASDDFIDDPAYNGFDNNAAGLSVSDRLARDYRRAAESIADEVTADEDLVGMLAPCDLEEDDTCVSVAISDLGERAYRRPLSNSELAAYLDLYAGAVGLYSHGTASEQGIRLVVETMLQSPNFLYRVELSSDVAGETELVPLDGWELAARLSFLLWNSMPDDELFDAAREGRLTTREELEAQARRMVADPRARATVRDFHRQWLHLDEASGLAKSASLYPEWDPALGEKLGEETQRFIEHVAFEMDGGFGDLLTSRTTFLDEDLAELYGVHGDFGPEFEKFEYTTEPRKGLLTQAGFLATHAYPDRSSPIHRGVFVQRQLLCLALPDPPPDVDLELPELDGDVETTRDQVEAHTASDVCQSCHGLINPAGFAFEHYDAVGGFREVENGVEVDASGTLPLADGGTLVFDDALDLADQIAESEVARACYLRQWFRYGFGRFETPDDACTLDQLEVAVRGTDYDLTELLVAFTGTTSFRFRAP